jgi:hypothetical protein
MFVMNENSEEILTPGVPYTEEERSSHAMDGAPPTAR